MAYYNLTAVVATAASAGTGTACTNGLAQNYERASPVIVGASLIVAVGIAGIIGLIHRRAYKRLDELENV